MASKKNNIVQYLIGAGEIVISIVLICTLAMTALTITTNTSSAFGVVETTDTSTMSVIEFISKIFSGDINGGWAIATMVIYFVTLLLALVVIVLSILKMCGVPLEKLPKCAFEVLLVVFSLLVLLMGIIITSGKETFSWSVVVSGEVTTAISWAFIITPICGAGTLLLRLLEV
jgi:hypothetical protein